MKYIRTLEIAAERLRRRSREQKIPSSIPRLDISVEVTDLNANFHMFIFV